MGSRSEMDKPFICWMMRHCCWTAAITWNTTDGPLVRRFGTCAEEAIRVDVPGPRLVHDSYELNGWKLVRLSETENSAEHQCGNEHGACRASSDHVST